MQLKVMCLSFALAATVAVSSAEAADWTYSGVRMKDSPSGGIAVPAPIPVPETFRWYLRADVGVGLPTGGNASSTGNIFGQDILAPASPFGMSSSWFQRDHDAKVLGGFGAGLYLTPRLRTDLTIDIRDKSDVGAAGTYSYSANPTANGAAAGNTVQVAGRFQEETAVRSTLALANLYWDLAERGSRFVPYIGAGVGFVVNSVNRTLTGSETVNDITAPATPLFLNSRELNGGERSLSLSPAAAVMAGVGYTLDSGMVIDLSYRFAYMGSSSSSTNVAYSQAINGVASANSKLSLNDSFEHALRAGVRWNVW